MWGQGREVTDPGTHQSVAGTEGCCPDAGPLLQHGALEMAGRGGGGHHRNMGEVPIPSLHDVAFGKKSLIDRQVKKQVLVLMGESIVHPVLWAIQVPLPPAAGDGMVQAVGQKVAARIYADGRHHVVLWQGLDEMLWGKRRQN